MKFLHSYKSTLMFKKCIDILVFFLALPYDWNKHNKEPLTLQDTGNYADCTCCPLSLKCLIKVLHWQMRMQMHHAALIIYSWLLKEVNTIREIPQE